MSTPSVGVLPGAAVAGPAYADASRLGVRAFLATVAMLFAAFTSAYLVRRGGADWTPIALPSVLWRNTAVLVASSVALEAAWWAGRRRRQPLANAAFVGALGLGVWFLQGQVLAWNALRAAGVLLPTGPHAAFVYVLTVAHALHVLAALGVLTWGAARTWTGLAVRDPARWEQVMSGCRTFWHFLLAVWVYVFVLMSSY